MNPCPAHGAEVVIAFRPDADHSKTHGPSAPPPGP